MQALHFAGRQRPKVYSSNVAIDWVRGRNESIKDRRGESRIGGGSDNPRCSTSCLGCERFRIVAHIACTDPSTETSHARTRALAERIEMKRMNEDLPLPSCERFQPAAHPMWGCGSTRLGNKNLQGVLHLTFPLLTFLSRTSPPGRMPSCLSLLRPVRARRIGASLGEPSFGHADRSWDFTIPGYCYCVSIF